MNLFSYNLTFEKWKKTDWETSRSSLKDRKIRMKIILTNWKVKIKSLSTNQIYFSNEHYLSSFPIILFQFSTISNSSFFCTKYNNINKFPKSRYFSEKSFVIEVVVTLCTHPHLRNWNTTIPQIHVYVFSFDSKKKKKRNPIKERERLFHGEDTH